MISDRWMAHAINAAAERRTAAAAPPGSLPQRATPQPRLAREEDAGRELPDRDAVQEPR